MPVSLYLNTQTLLVSGRERLRTHSIESSGKLKISAEQHWDFTAEDLKDLGEIGRGAYGSVNKMVHKPSNQIMAVKRIRSTVDEKEQKQLLMDLDVVVRSSDCPYIVQFYGALFREGDCWICMELMATSLDKFYKFVYCSLDDVIPEEILGKITLATVKALNHLKENLKIIHRGKTIPDAFLILLCTLVCLFFCIIARFSSFPLRHQAVKHPPGQERQHKAV